MSSGGYRPGAGRPKGTKNQNKIKINQNIQDKIVKNETPLEYMLRVMNDPNVDSDMRARMATAAAPYVHKRQGVVSVGKKEEQNERAKKAGAGRFAPGRAPLKLV